MKLIRVFPRRTHMTPIDDYAFVGDPPLIRPPADEVHISVAFTWDIEIAKRLAGAWSQYYPVRLGGPAFNSRCNGFMPGLYMKEGITFTSRGCNNRCPWCLVPEREGKLTEIRGFAAGNIIQDNNLLQCSREHIERVFEMLRQQHRIQFTGGLDASLISDDIAEKLRSVWVRQLFLACDTDAGITPLERAVRRLKMPRDKLRCYVLLGFNGEAIEQGVERLQAVWDIGCMPFAQLYQPPDHYIEYSKEVKHIAREWSRPAGTKAMQRGRDVRTHSAAARQPSH